MIHLYAFVDGLEALPRVDGLDGAPIQLRTIDGIDVVVSVRARTSDDASLQSDALAHGRVVEALADAADAVLPVRFAEEPADDAALVQAIRGRTKALRDGLDHVRGCVEVGVRVASREAPAVATATTGTEYLVSRRAAAAAFEDELAELEQRIALPARAVRTGTQSELYTAAALVPRRDVDAVRRAVQGFAAARPQLSVLCTGPWAPYSFAEVVA